MTIAIIGATGEFGGHVIDALERGVDPSDLLALGRNMGLLATLADRVPRPWTSSTGAPLGPFTVPTLCSSPLARLARPSARSRGSSGISRAGSGPGGVLCRGWSMVFMGSFPSARRRCYWWQRDARRRTSGLRAQDAPEFAGDQRVRPASLAQLPAQRPVIRRPVVSTGSSGSPDGSAGIDSTTFVENESPGGVFVSGSVVRVRTTVRRWRARRRRGSRRRDAVHGQRCHAHACPAPIPRCCGASSWLGSCIRTCAKSCARVLTWTAGSMFSHMATVRAS